MEVVTFTSVLGAIIGALTGSLGAALLGAAIGAGLSAVLIVIHETNRERKNRALDLIQEYTSPDYIQIRNDAGQALTKALKSQETPSWSNLFHNLPREEWKKISKIEHFYKKLNFMVDIGEADAKYVGKYFEKEFWHWQNRFFKKINIASDKPEMRFCALAAIIKNTQETESSKSEKAS
ncbi:hypothetical protein [uncultured Vibrio sp.]|uniref:hypothetical protein n=1 Tax=uncultured Vibrio sp. TaxID=114054 RepID=UPI0025DE47F2|nr:hypothetical protein [uncultured Vibrio sp.]